MRESVQLAYKIIIALRGDHKHIAWRNREEAANWIETHARIIEEQDKDLADAKAECERLRGELASAREEIAIDNQLITERDRLVNAIPECPEHGACIPHAIEWVEKTISSLEARDTEIARLGAELEVARVDAGRLDWLATRRIDICPPDDESDEYMICVDGDLSRTSEAPTLRAAIDAAMFGGW